MTFVFHELNADRFPDPPGAGKRGTTVQTAPVVDPKACGNYAAILFGTPARFGKLAAQMAEFPGSNGRALGQGRAGWRVGSVFASTGMGVSNESNSIGFVTTLMHHGLVCIGLL